MPTLERNLLNGSPSFAPSAMLSDASARPTITPNRHQCDNRFPCIAFTVNSGGRPFIEVLLATNPSHFLPENSSQRTRESFYASRQDSGLIRVTESDTVYVVAPAVLARFAEAQPRPRRIYYTAVSYADEQGRDPVLAIPTERLASDSAYVSLSPDFGVHSLPAGISMALDRLQRVGAPPAPPARTAISREEDLAQGEDGFGREPMATGAELWEEEPALASDFRGSDALHLDDGRIDGHGDPLYPESTHAVEPNGADRANHSGAAHSYEIPYSDGFEDDGALGRLEHTVPSALRDDEAETAPVQDEFEIPGGGYRDESDDSGALGIADPAAASYGQAAELYDEDDRELMFEALDAPAPPPRAELTPEAQKEILDQVAILESGDRYEDIRLDDEFEGRAGADHPAYGRHHLGVSVGRFHFNQDSGLVGEWLRMCKERDEPVLRRIMGAELDQVITVTTAVGPPCSESPSGRSARVQPVAGADLWREPWVSRLREVANHRPFQSEQNRLASRAFIEPMRRFAAWLGLDSARALAMIVDRAVQIGVAGARRWVIAAVSPVQTDDQRQQALFALGHPDVRSFQASQRDLAVDGQFDPLTHAALIAALRGLGGAAPVQVPAQQEMLDLMVRRAEGKAWADRVRNLRRSTAIRDTTYQL